MTERSRQAVTDEVNRQMEFHYTIDEPAYSKVTICSAEDVDSDGDGKKDGEMGVGYFQECHKDDGSFWDHDHCNNSYRRFAYLADYLGQTAAVLGIDHSALHLQKNWTVDTMDADDDPTPSCHDLKINNTRVANYVDGPEEELTYSTAGRRYLVKVRGRETLELWGFDLAVSDEAARMSADSENESR